MLRGWGSSLGTVPLTPPADTRDDTHPATSPGVREPFPTAQALLGADPGLIRYGRFSPHLLQMPSLRADLPRPSAGHRCPGNGRKGPGDGKRRAHGPGETFQKSEIPKCVCESRNWFYQPSSNQFFSSGHVWM